MVRTRKLSQVVCRQESGPDERPLRFRIDQRWIEVQAIHRSFLERGPEALDPTFRVFEIECERGRCELRVQLEGWVWELREP